MQTHGGQQLHITSRSGVLRPSSDIGKDETHVILLLFVHIDKMLLFIQSFQNKQKNSIYLAPNDTTTSDNIDVMNTCHPEK